MAPLRMKIACRTAVILLGLTLTACASANKAKQSEAPAPGAPPATTVAETPAPETKPLPPRPRPYFGPPPKDYDPLSGTHKNLFDPQALGAPQVCCPIHGFNPPTK